MCSCAEGKIFNPETGTDEATGVKAHNCNYITQRNLLIPIAEKYADEVAENGSSKWSKAFHRKMNELARKL